VLNDEVREGLVRQCLFLTSTENEVLEWLSLLHNLESGTDLMAVANYRWIHDDGYPERSNEEPH
jgi:hypothetical protein